MPRKKVLNSIIYILILLNVFLLSAIISLRLTLQGEMVIVPDVIGNTIDVAKEMLNEKKLLLKKNGVRLHERLEEGKIIFQDPLPGSR